MKKRATPIMPNISKTKRLKVIICAFILPSIFIIFLLQNDQPVFNGFFWFGVFPIAVFLLIAYIIASIIWCRMLKKKEFNIAKMRLDILRKKDNMVAEHEKYRRKNTKLSILVHLYLYSFVGIFIIIHAALFTCFVRLLQEYSNDAIIFAIIPAFILTLTPGIKLLGRLFEKTADSIDGIHMYMSRYEYPQIWDIAIAAKIQIGIKGNLSIVGVSGSNIGITSHDKTQVLLIGFETLRLLNQAELYAVFLHEFGHANNKQYLISRKNQKLSSTLERLSTRNKLHPAFLFIPVFAMCANSFSVYSFLMSYMSEQDADSVITKPNDITNFINAIAKLDLYSIWTYELPKRNFYNIETAPTNYFEIVFQNFISEYQKNKEKWENMCLNRLEARIDTHPNLRERMNAFGKSEFFVDFSKDPNLTKEAEKTENELLPFITQDWTSMHNNYFLQYEETVSKYQNTLNLTIEQNAKLANAYFGLCNYETALKYYDMVLAEIPTHAQAIYRKGLILCDRYDDTGIDLLYQSISNANYSETAFLRLSLYLQYMGLDEKRTQLRHGMYSKIDQTISIEASKKFKISQHTLPFEVFNKIKDSVKAEVEIFTAAYLANKRVNIQDNNSLFLCLRQDADNSSVAIALENLNTAISNTGTEVMMYIFRDISQMGKLSKLLIQYSLFQHN